MIQVILEMLFPLDIVRVGNMYKKYIITSGCSFTHNFKVNVDNGTKEHRWKNEPTEDYTWFHWLCEELGEEDYEFYNYGTITNDNKTICRSIFYKVSDLVFNQKVNPKDIIVIAQWTTLTRNSWFISPSKYIENGELDIQKQGKTNRPLPHTTDYLTFKDKRYVYEHGYFYMTGGYNKTEQYLDDYTEKYFNDVLSKEERYIEWFDSVVGLISWLENIGIGKFNSFNMNNNFSKSALEGRTPPDDVWWNRGDVYDQMVTQKRIANTWNDDIIIYDNPYVKTYADRIDFDKYFWFFEEENLHKYGGIIEWSIRNFDENQKSDLPVVLWRELNGMSEREQRKYLNKSWYGHTSSILTRKFVNEIILNLIGK